MTKTAGFSSFGIVGNSYGEKRELRLDTISQSSKLDVGLSYLEINDLGQLLLQKIASCPS